MIKLVSVFSGFTVDDIHSAKRFYSETLGFELEDKPGGTSIRLTQNTLAWMYLKIDHQPARYTILNFVVNNIDNAVEKLRLKGVVFERYEGSPQDEKGIMRGKAQNMGPDIAWFKDPAGNILALLEN